MESDYDLACTKSRVLLRESNWTKTIFRYLAAITTLRRGLPKEAKRVDELMRKVEPGKQKFCGVEIFPEVCSLFFFFFFFFLWNKFA
jgi:hypothetical protein